MPHINQFLPKNSNEYKKWCFKSLLDSPSATDTFKIGDRVRIQDSETNEIWKIHKFIAHSSEKLAAILLQEDDLQASYLPCTSVVELLEQLTLI